MYKILDISSTASLTIPSSRSVHFECFAIMFVILFVSPAGRRASLCGIGKVPMYHLRSLLLSSPPILLARNRGGFFKYLIVGNPLLVKPPVTPALFQPSSLHLLTVSSWIPLLKIFARVEPLELFISSQLVLCACSLTFMALSSNVYDSPSTRDFIFVAKFAASFSNLL